VNAASGPAHEITVKGEAYTVQLQCNPKLAEPELVVHRRGVGAVMVRGLEADRVPLWIGGYAGGNQLLRDPIAAVVQSLCDAGVFAEVLA
jgi:hypothetical protein